MGAFGEYSTALKMRAIMQSVAERAVNRLRPAPRIAEVVDFNPSSRTADVQMAGDEGTIQVRFYPGLQPRRKKNDNAAGDAPCDVVRVEGGPGNYYITQVLNGPPVIEGVLPAGVFFPFPGIVLPAGYLWMDGTQYLKAEYPSLYAAIGDLAVTAQGLSAPADPAYFKVFDGRDRMIVGAGTKGLGTVGGAFSSVIGLTNLPPHTHDMAHNHGRTDVGGTHTHDYTWRENSQTATGSQSNIVAAGGTSGQVVTKRSAGVGSSDHDHNVPAYSGQTGSGSSQGLNSTPYDFTNKYFAANYIIKY